MASLNIDDIKQVLESLACEVYQVLGSGFDEHIYQSAMAYELRQAGFRFQREVNIEIFYKGTPVGLDRPDFILRPCDRCPETILVEIKTVDRLNDNHSSQLKAYLKSIQQASDTELRDCRWGVLINFPKKEGNRPQLEYFSRENS